MDDAGSVLVRERRSTPSSAGYDAVLNTLRDLVRDLEQRANTQCMVGIGTPGTVSARTGRMKNSNTVSLNDRCLKQDLEQRLQRTVRVANDANCFVLSEATDGAAQRYSVVFGVIMGTGVGGGIAIDKVVHRGPQSIAGEWGHNVLEVDGPVCYCGKRGCVETLISGPGLEGDYRAHTGRQLCAEEIVAQAAQGEADAEAAMQRFLDRYGRALAAVINILDPDAIVLGGGLSNIGRLYSEGRRCVACHIFSDELITPILRNRHGDSSGVRGAAHLWPPAFTC